MRRAKATAVGKVTSGDKAAGLVRVTRRAKAIAGKVTRRRGDAAPGTAQAGALKRTGSQRRRRSK
jgi:hypothetical protein